MIGLRNGMVTFLVDQERTLATETAGLRHVLRAALDLLHAREAELARLRARHHCAARECRELRAEVRKQRGQTA